MIPENQSRKDGAFKIFKEQLYLLLWKNFVLQKRSIIGTILELTIPALFVFILIPIRIFTKINPNTNDSVYNPFSVDYFDSSLIDSQNFSFCFYPKNFTNSQNIMNEVSEILNMKYTAFNHETEMVDSIKNNFQNNLFGISVLNDSINNFTYKLRFSYSPRNAGSSFPNGDVEWKTNLLFTVFPVLGPREKSDNTGGDPGYYREGFLTAQKAIDMAIIKAFEPNINKVDIKLKRFSYQPYEDDLIIIVLVSIFPYILEMSFVFTFILTAKAIVYEKETGIKEAMKLMGMKNWIYWLSWYIKTYVLLLPTLILMIMSYTIKIPIKSGGDAAVINLSDPVVFALFLFLFASSLITFMFVCSTFFKKANNAASGCAIIFLLSYMPYAFISLRYEQLSHLFKLSNLLINSLAMCYGVFLIAVFEAQGTGIQFSNITKGMSINDNISMAHVMFFLFFNNFVHLLLLSYFEKVLPGDHGIAEPWYFPIKFILPKSILNKINRNNESESLILPVNIKNNNYGSISQSEPSSPSQEVNLEDELIYASRNIGIKLTNIGKVYKQFGQHKKAVNDLSLNIFEGQITVLLGHNGAGKSTTISMITGLCAPTSGNITINGKDMIENTDEARSQLGYCPQHNLLFDDLTVYEHLEFYSKLKRNFNSQEIHDMIEMMNLTDKKYSLAKTLSGGMKRKLSVAIAFIGGSKIVILDEPSSGMDPQARHTTWSLLQKFKNEMKCTILLTTHFMDEADILGDRIAIMHNGQLKCCGSPLYLKSKYSSGYNLILTKKKKNNYSNSNSFNNLQNLNQNFELSDSQKLDSLINLIQGVIPDAILNSNINSEISFKLFAKDSNKFPSLFDLIEQEKDKFDITNVGISVTTVEDVFLKVGDNKNIQTYSKDNGKESNKFFFQNIWSKSKKLFFKKQNYQLVNRSDEIFNQVCDENININDDSGLWTGSKKEDLVSSKYLYFQQIQALIKKRIIHSLRNKSLIISQIILPAILLLVNIIYIKYGPIKPGDSQPLLMDLNQYGKNFVPFYLENNNPILNSISSYYQNQFSNTKNIISFNLNDTTTMSYCPQNRKNLDEYLSCMGRSSNYIYNSEHFVAANLASKRNNRIQLTAHFNNQPYHVPSVTLNVLTNSLLKHFTNSSTSRINVINHPLPRNLTDITFQIQTKDSTSLNIASGLTTGFSILIASFSIFLIKERVSGAKHLQYLNGCSPYTFWLSAFIWDMLNYFIPVIFGIILLKAFNIYQYVDDLRWLDLATICFAYGLAHIPQVYLFSFLFKVSSNGFAFITSWNILTSQATLILVTILNLPALGLQKDAKYLETIFSIFFPNYALGQALENIYNNYQIIQTCKNYTSLCSSFKNPCCKFENKNETNPCGSFDCLDWNENYWSWDKPGLLKFVVFMLLQFVLQLLILILLENGSFVKITYLIKNVFQRNKNLEILNDDENELEGFYEEIPKDSDVIDEENRISELSSYDNYTDIFIANKLKKIYKNFVSVKGISFSLHKAECFGLLGVNGAGKTTTFKMITGDEMITEGEAYLNKTSIKRNIKKFQKQLGYCPQFDPLIDQMTVLETMIMYAKLRGIKNDLIKKTCMSLINMLDLNEHTNKMCYTLSGGNKRKLSVAISLVGSPIVVLLDEPTSGMDPKTKRTLWNCLNKIRTSGKSLILTTHSMDETEELCTNIGIMVNGELKCLGSLQNLKSKYGDGYTLLIKIAFDYYAQSNTKDFISFIISKFNKCELKENRDGFVNIKINDNSTKTLSSIFSIIEENKDKFSIEYYCVTQTKLEQIFLNLASRQIDPESRLKSKSFGICCC